MLTQIKRTLHQAQESTMSCPTIIGLKFDSNSISGIERLKNISELSAKLKSIIAIGAVANIFIGNQAPAVIFNIYSSDWQALHDSIDSISLIKKRAILTEVTNQMFNHTHDINQHNFWKAIYNGCL